jgi:hypothetical protein
MKARKKEKRSRPVKTGARALQPIVLGGLMFSSALAAAATDPHLIPVTGDTDADYLSDVEERTLFSNAIGIAVPLFHDPQNPDENSNQILDGVDLCRNLTKRISDLRTFRPWDDLPTTYTFKVERFQYGIVGCPICGQTMNMGCYEIVNPILQTETWLSVLALHFMEHDSFTWYRWSDPPELQARVNILQLLSVLDGHPAPIAGDADLDLLTDAEEAALGTPPDQRDADRNDIPDGMDLAWSLARRIADLGNFLEGDELPTDRIFRIDCPQRGVHYCPIFGEDANMGYTEIINPLLPARMMVPLISFHYMKHGSFGSGVERLDVKCLLTTLGLRLRPAGAEKSWTLYE